MTKAEDRLMDFLKEHRLLLGYIFATVMNLFLRKVAVWWNSDDMLLLYDGHPNRVHGELWLFIMRFGMLFPILPVHFMKWFTVLGDFLMAGVGAKYLKGEKGLAFYSISLIMPFTLYRGIVLSLTDSFGMACFFYAYLFANKDVIKICVNALGVLFCPALIIPLCFEYIRKKDACALGLIVLLVAVVSGLMGVVNGTGFIDGMFGQINFLSYETFTGITYQSFSSYLIGMICIYAFPASVVGLFRYIDSYKFKNA